VDQDSQHIGVQWVQHRLLSHTAVRLRWWCEMSDEIIFLYFSLTQCLCVYFQLCTEMALQLTADCVHPLLFPAHTSNEFSEMDLTADPVMACISVRCVTNVWLTISIVWCTTRHTQKNVHTCITSVGSVSHSLIALRLTLSYIQVNAHIRVKIVAGVSVELHIYRNTLFCMRGRGLMRALSAQRHLYAWLIWRTILLYTLWTSHMSASCVPRCLQHQLTCRHIATHTRAQHDVGSFSSAKMWITSLVLRSIWKCEVCPSHFCTEASICTHTFKLLYLRSSRSTPQLCIITVQAHHRTTNPCI
jgi:hypothetical protein